MLENVAMRRRCETGNSILTIEFDIPDRAWPLRLSSLRFVEMRIALVDGAEPAPAAFANIGDQPTCRGDTEQPGRGAAPRIYRALRAYLRWR